MVEGGTRVVSYVVDEGEQRGGDISKQTFARIGAGLPAGDTIFKLIRERR